jgi:hypothetical protein
MIEDMTVRNLSPATQRCGAARALHDAFADHLHGVRFDRDVHPLPPCAGSRFVSGETNGLPPMTAPIDLVSSPHVELARAYAEIR